MITTLPPMAPAGLPWYFINESLDLPHQGQQILCQDWQSPNQPQHHVQQQSQSQPYAVFPVQHMRQYPQQTQTGAARLQQVSPQPLNAVPPVPVARTSGVHYTFPVVHAPGPKHQQGYQARRRRPSVRQIIEPRLYNGEGLHDTLARRSSSAVELFNIYNRRQKRSPAQPGLQTSIPKDGQGDALQQQGGQIHLDNNNELRNQQQSQQQHQQQQTLHQIQVSQYPQQHSQEQAHQHQHHYSVPQYRTTTKVLPFDSQAHSLPAFRPFGMPSSASPQLSYPPWQQQQADGSGSQQSKPLSFFQQLDVSNFLKAETAGDQRGTDPLDIQSARAAVAVHLAAAAR